MTPQAEYRGLYTALLVNADYLPLSPAAKLVLVTLRLNLPRLGIGANPALRHTLAGLTGLDPAAVDSALADLTEAGWIKRDGIVVWIVNAWKHSGGYERYVNSPSLRVSVQREWAGLPNSMLKEEFRAMYGAWFAAVSERHGRRSRTPSPEGVGEGVREGVRHRQSLSHSPVSRTISEVKLGKHTEGPAENRPPEEPALTLEEPGRKRRAPDPLLALVVKVWTEVAGPVDGATDRKYLKLASQRILAAVSPKARAEPERLFRGVIRDYHRETLAAGYTPSPKWLVARYGSHLPIAETGGLP